MLAFDANQSDCSRDMDLIMATCFNGCERNERGWRELFERADKRFIFKGITTPQGSMMSLIEAVWEP